MRLRCVLTGHLWQRTDERTMQGAGRDGGLVSTTQYQCKRCGKTTVNIVRGG